MTINIDIGFSLFNLEMLFDFSEFSIRIEAAIKL